MAAGGNIRGKSGLQLARVPGNARRGQPQGKRHREETATTREVRLRQSVVKVKRWGKSPPRTWQQGRHGKPHPEQRQIGASRQSGPGSRSGIPLARDANAREARVGSLTAVVTRLAEEWSSSPGPRSGGDRIRLTGSPRTYHPCLAGPTMVACLCRRPGAETGHKGETTKEDHCVLHAERSVVSGGMAGASLVGRLRQDRRLYQRLR